MSATLLEAPRRAAAPPPRAVEPGPGPEKPRPRPGRNILPIALAASAFVHVLILGIRFTAVTLGDGEVAPPQLLNVEMVPGIRVLDIVPVAADVPTPQVVVVAPRPLEPPRAQPAAQTPAPPAQARTPAARAADPPRTVVERITPRAGGDPRLWARGSDPLRPELDPLNNVRARVYGSIAAYNDSIAAAAEAAARALDWTVRDANGGRWGVSPSGIHLGTVTLPLPALGTSAEQRETMRQWSEIQQQAGRAQVEETFDERVRAIRARRDAARDSARRGGGN
jgi:hypothetical protein